MKFSTHFHTLLFLDEHLQTADCAQWLYFVIISQANLYIQLHFDLGLRMSIQNLTTLRVWILVWRGLLPVIPYVILSWKSWMNYSTHLDRMECPVFTTLIDWHFVRNRDKNSQQRDDVSIQTTMMAGKTKTLIEWQQWYWINELQFGIKKSH